MGEYRERTKIWRKPSRIRWELDIKRAIATSLNQEYVPNSKKMVNGNYKNTRNGQNDLEKDIVASSGQQYGGRSNHNGNGGNYVNFEDEDDELQRAIAASL